MLSGYEHNEHLKLLAFSLPENMDRSFLKRVLLNRIDKSLLNSDNNFGYDHDILTEEMEDFINSIMNVLFEKIGLLS